MKQEIQKKYAEKLVSARDAVRMIHSGDRVYCGTGASTPYKLLEELWNYRHELEGVTIMSANNYESSPVYDESYDNPFLYNTFFIGINERKRFIGGSPLTYNSVHLSFIDIWSNEIAKPDVCLLEVSTPDDEGNFYLGPSGVSIHRSVKNASKKTIVQVNKYTPHVLGEYNTVNIDEIDAIVEYDKEYGPFPGGDPDEISSKIAAGIINEIPDGATIQLGLGNLSTAIGYGLKEKNDLGVFTEVLSPPLVELMENGNVTNRCKGIYNGKTVYGFAIGKADMYKTLDWNPDFYALPYTIVNDPRIIAQNNNMISINATMSVNLLGEAASDCIGWKQRSAVGGQTDYVKGSQWSKGGKSFIATSSSFIKNGKRISKIVPFFPPGTVITTTRSDIHFLATEYGVIDLRRLTCDDRARAIISLAHPDFREELYSQAKKYGLL